MQAKQVRQWTLPMYKVDHKLPTTRDAQAASFATSTRQAAEAVFIHFHPPSTPIVTRNI